MEQQKDTQNAPTPMVDVKPPEPTTPQVPEDIAASIHESEMQVASAPQSSAPATDEVRQPPAATESEADNKAQEEQEAPVPEQNNKVASSSEANKKPMAMVIAAILVGFGLAALSVYAYMATNQDENNGAADSQQVEGQNTVTLIDDTTAEIDRALDSVATENDFADASLSDETLGL